MSLRIVIAREDAYDRGLRRFYTGEPCKKGHVAERYVVNGACIECQNWRGKRESRKGPQGRNVGWPTQGLVFSVKDILPEEIEAAFRYMEHNGWHDTALLAVRNDPALLVKHTIPMTAEEQGILEATLARDQRTRAALKEDQS